MPVNWVTLRSESTRRRWSLAAAARGTHLAGGMAMDLKSDKIADPELRRFANADVGGESRTVIVELSLPPVAFPQERTPRPRAPSSGPTAQFEVGASVDGDAEMTKLEQELKRLGL